MFVELFRCLRGSLQEQELGNSTTDAVICGILNILTIKICKRWRIDEFARALVGANCAERTWPYLHIELKERSLRARSVAARCKCGKS